LASRLFEWRWAQAGSITASTADSARQFDRPSAPKTGNRCSRALNPVDTRIMNELHLMRLRTNLGADSLPPPQGFDRERFIALERRAACAYSASMNDTPRHKRPADRDPPMPSEPELLASLARSEAEFASGLLVSGDEVLRELDESIARMEAKRSGGTPRRTAARR
jgi:hypothetical protein